MIRQFDSGTLKRWTLGLFLILLILLVACNLSPSAAMEESFASQYVAVSDFRLQQQVPWQEGGVALVTFSALNDQNMKLEKCRGVSYYKSGSEGYAVFASKSSCGSSVRVGVPGGESTALETIPNGNLTLVEQDTSVAFGLVGHPEGAHVRVDWCDGASETVKVSNRSYLAPRRGFSEVKEVILLDRDGNLLATVRL